MRNKKDIPMGLTPVRERREAIGGRSGASGGELKHGRGSLGGDTARTHLFKRS
jgi:hypothetical protein